MTSTTPPAATVPSNSCGEPVLLIGVDLGTTSVKAVVFSEDGQILATGRSSTPWELTADGAQSTAEELRDAAFTAIHMAVKLAPTGRIAGVGIASLAESGVVLDADDRSVMPVIAWYDRRDHEELAQLGDFLGAERFSTITGLPFAQQWSLTKSRWLSTNDRAAHAAGRLRLSVAEWIAYALGGRAVSEPSLASRTGWLDLAAKSWWPDALRFSRIPADWLPEIADAGTDLGSVTAEIHPRLTGARIAVAGHDHQAAAVGAGAWNSGDVLDSCGTAEALVRTADPGLAADTLSRLSRGGVTVGWHALPGYWCLLGATEGGRALGHTLRALNIQDVSLGLDDAALSAAPGTLRIDSDTTPGTIEALVAKQVAPGVLWRAAVEGVTEEVQRLSALMSTSTGPTRRFLAVGGWTASAALITAKRHYLGSVEIPDIPEAGARGAALFAGSAAGLWEDVRASGW